MEIEKKSNQLNGHRAVTPSSILSEKLAVLKNRLIEKASEAEVLALVEQCQDLIDPLEHYLLNNTSNPSEALNALELETNNLDWDTAFKKAKTNLKLEKEMLSGKVEGQFLKMLIAITNAEYVLEIGCFTGYASLAMAEALPKEGKLIACEYDKFTAKFASEQLSKSEHGNKVDIRIGDASKTMKELIADTIKFDFVFIDANKTGYLNYYKSIMDGGLLRKNGLICVDNTLFMGQAYSAFDISENGKAIKQFNAFVAQDDRVQNVLVPLRDGISMIRRIL